MSLTIILPADSNEIPTYAFNTRVRETISGLPENLYNKLSDALLQLKGNQITNVSYDQKKVLLMQNELYYPIDHTGKFSLSIDTVKSISFVIDLMYWFLGPRFNLLSYGKRMNVGLSCVECGLSHLPMHKLYCVNMDCPSHKKLAIVHGQI